jgi:hypothetical protein
MTFAKREFCGRIFCCFDRSRSETEFFNKISPILPVNVFRVLDRFSLLAGFLIFV